MEGGGAGVEGAAGAGAGAAGAAGESWAAEVWQGAALLCCWDVKAAEA